MTDPITAFFKELWRDKDKERLQRMQSSNRELSAAVSRIELQISRLKKKKHPPTQSHD
jgi:hypothetical protein